MAQRQQQQQQQQQQRLINGEALAPWQSLPAAAAFPSPSTSPGLKQHPSPSLGPTSSSGDSSSGGSGSSSSSSSSWLDPDFSLAVSRFVGGMARLVAARLASGTASPPQVAGLQEAAWQLCAACCTHTGLVASLPANMAAQVCGLVHVCVCVLYVFVSACTGVCMYLKKCRSTKLICM